MRRRWSLYRRKVNPFEDGLPDYRQRRMCFGKQMLNKQQAIQMAARMRKHYGASDTLGHYRCEICKHWHVGNNRRRGSE